MFRAAAIVEEDKASLYRSLAEQAGALLAGERDPIANAANICALLFDALPDVNWAGFYFLRDNRELVLGPFQGKPACVRIAIGRGVCGSAVEQRRSLLVPDVHAFPGHIACDSASRSELVVPLMAKSDVLGVIDLDSPLTSRFDSDDRRVSKRSPPSTSPRATGPDRRWRRSVPNKGSLKHHPATGLPSRMGLGIPRIVRNKGPVHSKRPPDNLLHRNCEAATCNCRRLFSIGMCRPANRTIGTENMTDVHGPLLRRVTLIAAGAAVAAIIPIGAATAGGWHSHGSVGFFFGVPGYYAPPAYYPPPAYYAPPPFYGPPPGYYPSYPAVQAAAPPPPPPFAQAQDFTVYFDFDRWNLTADGARIVDQAIALARQTGAAQIQVGGFTDLAGTTSYNYALAQSRAVSVRNYMVTRGIPAEQIVVKSFGKNDPRVRTPDGVREAQNRRVEIVISPPANVSYGQPPYQGGQMPPQGYNPPPPPGYYTN